MRKVNFWVWIKLRDILLLCVCQPLSLWWAFCSHILSCNLGWEGEMGYWYNLLILSSPCSHFASCLWFTNILVCDRHRDFQRFFNRWKGSKRKYVYFQLNRMRFFLKLYRINTDSNISIFLLDIYFATYKKDKPSWLTILYVLILFIIQIFHSGQINNEKYTVI